MRRKEFPLSTMVVRMEWRPESRAEVIRHLREEVVIWAYEQPGFVTESWHVSEDGRWGLGLVPFATTSAAESAAQAPRAYHDPQVLFRIASVEVYQQVARSPQSAVA